MDLEEEDNGLEGQTFNCPKCGEPQESFLYHKSKRGWAKCQSCGKYIRTSNIPDDFVETVKSVSVLEPEAPMDEKMEEIEREYEEETSRVPFRRPRPPHIILKQVLEQFSVKKAAKNIMITRCRRVGRMHPTEIQRMLMDLDSGLNNKEAGYVADEYYFAIQNEERAAEEAGGGGFYGWERDTKSGARYGRASVRGGRAGYTPPSSKSRRERAWEVGREGSLDEQRLLEILDRRDREFEERLRRNKLEDNLTQLMKQVVNLSNELKNIKEHPPSAGVPPNVVTKDELESMQADAYRQTLEAQLDSIKEDRRELMQTIKEDRRAHKEDLKEMRGIYTERIEKLQEEIKDARRNAGHSTEGYQDDNVRLAAEGLQRTADIVERKEPVKIIIQGLRDLSDRGKGSQPPSEKVGEEGITAQIPEEYLER